MILDVGLAPAARIPYAYRKHDEARPMQLLMPKVVHQQFQRDIAGNQFVLDQIAAGHRYFQGGSDITDEKATDAEKRRDLAAAIVAGYTPY